MELLNSPRRGNLLFQNSTIYSFCHYKSHQKVKDKEHINLRCLVQVGPDLKIVYFDSMSRKIKIALGYIQINMTRLKASKSDCFQCGFSNVDYAGCDKSLFVAFCRF